MTLKEFAELSGYKIRFLQNRLQTDNPPAEIKAFSKFGNTYNVEVNKAALKKKLMKK